MKMENLSIYILQYLLSNSEGVMDNSASEIINKFENIFQQ